MHRSCHLAIAILLGALVTSFAADQSSPRPIGVARVDITPTYPIRLSGYAVRKTEATNAVQKLWVKALAIGSDREGPAILITVDNTGVPKHVRDEVVTRLAKKKIDPSRIAICSTHSHTAPYLDGYLPTLFGEPLPSEHQAHVQRYTRELTDAIEKVALQALKDRRPGRLSRAQGKAGFAANRRTKGGPVDHDLPMLAVTDTKGKLRAILANYACHCTTLGGEFNQLCGDWAGYAQEFLERDHPGATVLVAIGCGADANPQPRPGLDLAKHHGLEIATNINRLLQRKLTPVHGPLECRAKEIHLPLDTPPTRAEFEARAKETNYVGYHARWTLAKLDRGEPLPTHIPYLVQAWSFGDDLGMVFLPGEVVVDYSLRLKKEFDSQRLWVNAYANDVPCYVPSERILTEGGYEGGGAMTYYGWPARIVPGVEKLIVDAVHELLPKSFLFDEQQAEFPPPLSPEASLDALETKPGLEVQLVASEPLIVDPVAIDWGADGKLWVVEMHDYPSGLDGNWKPGGRVKYLEDTNRDGKYDKATLVVDGLPFPTGVTAWRDGALVSAAPDILYVACGRADLPVGSDAQQRVPIEVKEIFSGFVTENYQARVNSLSLGLDNWIYGANGLLGGTIRGVSSGAGVPPAGNAAPPAGTTGGTLAAGTPAPLREIDIRGRDFRMNPDTGDFESVSGLTQQGRARDDWGNWFGCDNSTLAWHYPIADHYVRRNPHVAAPTPRVSIARGADANRLYPISRTLDRFNHPESVNRATSVCGLGVHRDTSLGTEYDQNLFVCDSVHNLVRRLVLKPQGVTFNAEQAPDERQSEFLASRDNWFRPVQVRTGPDGALYVVDMYRFVIEHPRWIPPERLAKLDVRAGADKGRIYRVMPKGTKFSPPQNLRKLSTPELVAALDTPNGTTRDLVHLELTQRGDKTAIRPLEELARKAAFPAVRLQALCVLEGLNALPPELVVNALSDSHAAVRANAVRLSERFLPGSAGVSPALPADSTRQRDAGAPGNITAALLRLTNDPALTVRYQLALSLGEWDDSRAGEALVQLAQHDLGDAWMRAALVSSATRHAAEILNAILKLDPKTAGRTELIGQLIATAADASDPGALGKIITLIAPSAGEHPEAWQLSALGSLLDALDRRNIPPADLQADEQLQRALSLAAQLAATEAAADALRESAIRLLGRTPDRQTEDMTTLVALLARPLPAILQTAVLDSLRRVRSSQLPGALLDNWAQRSPSLRQACVDLLISRPEWTKELLKAIASGTVAPSEISPENRQRLLTHRAREIQEAAGALFKSAGSNRKEVLAQYQSALSLTGEAARGGEVFTKNCATCHRLRGQGHDVGPNLAALTDKSLADWLLGILDPNAVVEPRYVAYNLETKDDRSLSGIVSAETATTLTLIQSGGGQESILRSEIASMRASGLSLMPEGLEQAIPPQDLADLIAFLKASPRPFGSATQEQAEAARRSFFAAGANDVARIVSAFDQLPYPSWMGSLPMPYCRQTDGKSRLVWESQSVPAELKPDAFHEFRVPAGMGFVSQPTGKFELRVNGRPALDFNVALENQTWQSRDGQVQMSYTVMESNTEDSNGILLLRVAAALLAPGKPTTFEVVGSAANSQRWFGVYLVTDKLPNGLPQNATLIEKVLSDATPAKERETIINAHPELSAKFIVELTANLPPGAEEYRRIPWVWRVAVAAGKRNETAEITRILEVSLPKMDDPLRDWQAVVVGGGIINGIGLVGGWPKERVEEILANKADLLARWHRANDLAVVMADDESVKTGTRYDALRMIAMDSWDKRGAQLVKYLAQGVNAELQQGAISGLGDMRAPPVAAALASGLGHYSKSNREFALDALARDETRVGVLLDEIAADRVSKADLGEKRIERLKSFRDEKLVTRLRSLGLN
jgi:putative membrane-bound dehydrogenase-like protein